MLEPRLLRARPRAADARGAGRARRSDAAGRRARRSRSRSGAVGAAPASRRRGRPRCWFRSSTAPSRRCCSPCARRAAEPSRADRLPGRQDRSARRQPGWRPRCARPRRRSGSTPRSDRADRLSRPLSDLLGLSHPADGRARRAPTIGSRSIEREVADAFEVPLAFLMDARQPRAAQPRLEGRRSASTTPCRSASATSGA